MTIEIRLHCSTLQELQCAIEQAKSGGRPRHLPGMESGKPKTAQSTAMHGTRS